MNPTKRNFEPRVGFAWDPLGKGKTAVRGAFGIYDVLPLPYQFQLLTLLSAPFTEGASTPVAAGDSIVMHEGKIVEQLVPGKFHESSNPETLSLLAASRNLHVPGAPVMQ